MKKILLSVVLWIISLLLVWCEQSEKSEIILDEILIEQFWIIHNIEEWTIMLDNWEESITIMDKNLWTDIAWTWEESYWYYFQRWNNHGFQLNS